MLVWESIHSIHVGGLGVVATRTAEELVKKGHEVYLFTRWVEGQPKRSKINGVNYYRCKFYPSKNIISFFSNMSRAMVDEVRIVARHGGKFDIIHGHDWHMVDALYELEKEGYPVVLSYHSTEYGRSGGVLKTDKMFKKIFTQEKLGAKISDRLVTVSKSMRKELSRIYKIPREKVDIAPNAISPQKYHKDVNPKVVKKKYKVPLTSPTVLFIGRLEHQKGPDLLINAIPWVLKNRNDVKFLFAGRGTQRRRLGGRVRKLRVTRAVRFLGWIPYRRYVDLLNTCDVVCIPSRNEPFGIVLLEAWATGRPVVVTDVGGLGENVKNKFNGVKVRLKPRSIANGINYMINHPEAAKKIGARGRESVKKFNWKRTVKRVLKTYRKVIEARGLRV